MLRLSLLALALLVPGCCFGNATTPPPVSSVPAPVAPPSIGTGVLPTPAPLFAGVDAPYPLPGAAPGVEGYIYRSGSATVTSVTGLAGVTVGSQCSFTQYQITHSPTLDCRWNVTCGGYVAYGLGSGGYQRCNDPMWPTGTLMLDGQTSGTDTDPSFTYVGTTIAISDDAAGRNGAFSVTMSVP